jgi:hypothetical protein
MIEALHEPGTGEGLGDDGRGRKVELLGNPQRFPNDTSQR